MNELQNLKNFANDLDLEVRILNFEDKRKLSKYIIFKDKTKISQEMNYKETNSFLLGYFRASNFYIE